MSSDDHWVDDSYKRNSAFGQKRDDVRARGPNGAPIPPPAVAEKRQKQTMTNTQLRLAALPQEYLQQQKSPEEVGKYSPGYFAQTPGTDPTQSSSATNYPVGSSQQNRQPQYSQQNTQPNYSQQQSQPNYSQQNAPPNYQMPPQMQQGAPSQMQQAPSQNYPPQNYVQGQPGAPGPNDYVSPQAQFYSQSQRFSQQYGQPDYAQPTTPAEYAAQQQHFAQQQQFAQQQFAQQQQYAQQQQFAQQQAALQQQQQTADIPPARPARELSVEEIDDRALYDSGTRAYNLRHTLRVVRSELLRAMFFKRSMSLLIVSIDKFEEIHRDHTVVAVEKAIDAISRSLLQFCRPVDVVGRYMDRRFMIVCPEMDSQQATELAEKIRAMSEALVIAHNWKNINLSVSVGIASLSEECNDVESFIAMADLGADMVSENGGNGVFFAAGAE